MLLSTVFAEVLYMEKKTLSDKKSDNDVALGKDNFLGFIGLRIPLRHNFILLFTNYTLNKMIMLVAF